MLAEQGVYGRDGGIWDPGNISLAHVISEVTRCFAAVVMHESDSSKLLKWCDDQCKQVGRRMSRRLALYFAISEYSRSLGR